MVTFTDKYGNNSRLLCTKTDSLMYEVKTEDVCMKTLAVVKKYLILVLFDQVKILQ